MELELNIIDLIQNEGIALIKRGKALMGNCPFHDDRTPSFAVYENSNRFICFGCGEKGDAIDFIRKLKNFTFMEALTYLGINSSNRPVQISVNGSNKRKLISAFRKWENDYFDQLSTFYRTLNFISRQFETMREAEQHHLLYNQLPIWEYYMDTLSFGCDEEKFNLFKEVEL